MLDRNRALMSNSRYYCSKASLSQLPSESYRTQNSGYDLQFNKGNSKSNLFSNPTSVAPSIPGYADVSEARRCRQNEALDARINNLKREEQPDTLGTTLNQKNFDATILEYKMQSTEEKDEENFNQTYQDLGHPILYQNLLAKDFNMT